MRITVELQSASDIEKLREACAFYPGVDLLKVESIPFNTRCCVHKATLVCNIGKSLQVVAETFFKIGNHLNPPY